MNKLSIVFSGGGVRGIAHLGILHAFETCEIKADAVAGASAGAVAAAFYAGGFSAKETFDFLEETPFYTAWGNFTYNKPGLLDTENFRQYFEPFFPKDSFEALNIPCYITATDLIAAKEKVFSTGELINCILASCAFPFVFAPVPMNDTLYSDGGITNNFPVEPLESISSILIGIYVNPLKEMNVNSFSNSWKVSERAVTIRSYQRSSAKFDKCHIFIMPKELSQFNIFDKRQMKKIFDIGYEYGMKYADTVLTCLQNKGIQI